MENLFEVDQISPYFSGSFSILIKILVTSLFYRFNLVKNFFPSKNSFNYVLGPKFHKIYLFYHLLFVSNFLFQHSFVMLVFFWIKYLIHLDTNKTKNCLKFGKWTNIFVADFFPVKNSEI